MQFIKITFQDGNIGYINVSKIVCIYRDEDNDRTVMCYSCRKYDNEFVKETPEEIIRNIKEAQRW